MSLHTCSGPRHGTEGHEDGRLCGFHPESNRAKRAKVCWCLTGWLAAELKGFIDQVPSCSPDCWGPGCSRGGSDRGRSFWRRARPAKSGRLRYVVCSFHTHTSAGPYLPGRSLVWSGPSIPCRCAAGPRKNPPGLDANIQSPRTYQPIILPPISNSIATLSSPAPAPSLD